jgi:hypothetical protein
MLLGEKLKMPFNLSFVILGSQIMRPKVRSTYRSAKKHYESMPDLFSDVVAIDTNGRMECLQRSLCEPQRDMHDNFDLLYNGGTMEHVVNQKEGWRNCHYLLREGGIAVHVSPLSGGWPRHGRYHYTPEFFDELIRLNKYKIRSMPQVVKHNKGDAIYLSFQKMKTGVFYWKGCEDYIEEV